MKRPELHNYKLPNGTYYLDEYREAMEAYADRLESRNAELTAEAVKMATFLKDLMQLRDRQKEFFKKKSKPALIFCKETEPLMDARAKDIYAKLTEPKLF